MEETTNTINSILPNEQNRNLCLRLFVKSILEVDSYGSNKWGVYYTDDRIRLLVGSLIVFTLSNSKMWLALDKDKLQNNRTDKKKLDNSDFWVWDNGEYSEYSRIPSKNGYYHPVKNLRDWSIIQHYHFSYLRKAAVKFKELSVSSQKKHDSKLLIYLRKYLNQDIPEPNYNNLVEDLKIVDTKNIEKTERRTVIESRVGQGVFRNKLINYWNGCAVTECKKISLLKASHIKPWRDCNNNERLDRYNGLLLIPNLDSAFDRGFITFRNDGSILISEKLDESDKKKFGLNIKMSIKKVEENHKKYLKYHRANVFKG